MRGIKHVHRQRALAANAMGLALADRDRPRAVSPGVAAASPVGSGAPTPSNPRAGSPARWTAGMAGVGPDLTLVPKVRILRRHSGYPPRMQLPMTPPLVLAVLLTAGPAATDATP